MKVAEDLLVKAASHNDLTVRAFAAECRELAAENLRGRAFHQRSAKLRKMEDALRMVLCGGVSLAGAMEAAGLAAPDPRPLGSNPGDKAAMPRARR